jgi:hypothetical protein
MLLPYPPPYRSWLAISSDPDATTIDGWKELHEFIWEELGLPLGDSCFLQSFNENLAEQVTLASNPAILQSHCHDTLHGWGDYLCSTTRRFHRGDAEAGVQALASIGFRPLVWTDHASRSGNVIHNAPDPALPILIDATGHHYENYEYSLDLVHKIGVRYLWDGRVESDILGQDRNISRFEWYLNKRPWASPLNSLAFAAVDKVSGPLYAYLNPELFSYRRHDNRQYREVQFPDGSRFYTFLRYGKWDLADIAGLGTLLSAQNLDRLVKVGGTSIVYTHLGKASSGRAPGERLIPEITRTAFRELAQRHKEGTIQISSTSKLLDYLVLRDHAVVSRNSVDFQSDGIRWDSLRPTDLSGHSFGLRGNPRDIEFSCDGVPISPVVDKVSGDVYQVLFP